MLVPFSFLIGFSIILSTENCVCDESGIKALINSESSQLSPHDVSGLHTLVNAPRLRRDVGLKTCTPLVTVKYESRRCTQSRSRTTTERVQEGGWWWKYSHYKAKTVYYTASVCCQGYEDTGGVWWRSNPCKPICRGSSNTYVCNRNEGNIVFKDGSITTCSGGGCTSPNTCEMCNDGYYNDYGYCKACPNVLNCNHQRCSNARDSACVFCEQEVSEACGHKVYSHTIDYVNCVEMCSWREGNRCYPGKCLGDMVLGNDCNCSTGFNGPDCATFTATEELKILTNEVTLRGVGVPPCISPDSERPLVKVWTNQVMWSDVSIVVKTSAPSVDPPNVTFQSYLNDKQTKVGIERLVMSATLRRGNQIQLWSENQICFFNITCNIDIKNKSLLTIPWNKILNGGKPDHLDLITVTTALTYGGNVYYYNRDNTYKTGVTEKLEFYTIRGMTVNRTTEIQFDLYPPIHCLEDSPPCYIETIVVPDFVDKFPIPVHWDGWRDDHSGLRRFHLHVYQLEAKGGSDSVLSSKHAIVFQATVNVTDMTSTSINVTTPGPYFVEITAEDWAGNIKNSRRIFMYDYESRVDLTGSVGCVVSTADPASGNKWINIDSNMVEVTWPGRFINQRHHSNNWLNEVAMMDSISRHLDDTPSHTARNLSAIHNIRGIVKVMVGYNVSYGEGLPVETKVPVNVPPDLFDQERMVFQEELVDGKRLTFVVLGYDVMGQYGEDTTTVDIDLSPPIIARLWLTQGDVLNISVHSAEELNKLTIEWEAYDKHSGLHQISWRIFDNFTQTDVLHGNATESAQGEVKTLDECQTKYRDHARGARCYCTPYHGCFHKHYQIKPTVGSQGLLPDKQTGVHESDYFIEVTAINLAFLKTVSVIKITIDTSPPHQGTVHDGFDEQPEVDFQQSLTLHAHWDGFFDKESGVWFYMYAFEPSCLSSADFDLLTDEDLSRTRLKKTYSRSAEFDAPSEGTYHVTVAAYNHAYQHSIPVCSDGVTINNVAVRVTEVVVKGAVTREGLLTDGTGRVWLVYTSRLVEEIINPSSECIRRAITISPETLELYPGRRQANGTLSTIKSSAICNRPDILQAHLFAFVTSISHLELSWNKTGSSSVHDFEVALSSDNTSADKMDFVSSRGHQHIKITNPNIWDGEEFYVIIRTITKSFILHNTIVGPFVVDSTKPEFHGTVFVQMEQSAGMRHLVASWEPNAFEDHGDPAHLFMEVAVGSRPLQHDVLPFGRLMPGCSCLTAVTCTAINIDRLDWRLHGHQTYYVTVKATNTVGMFTLASSEEYIHDVELPSKGVVYDVDVNSNFLLQDIDDIDFQAATDTLSSRWSGFEHPHLNISYIVCVIDTNTSTALTCEATPNTEHTFTSLSLQQFQSYYHDVTAVSEAGNVSVRSDGVTVFEPDLELHQVSVHDGPACGTRQLDDAMLMNTSHHDEDKRLPCMDEQDYQSATNEMHVRWDVDKAVRSLTPDVYWAIEQRAPVTDFWQRLTDFEHIKTAHHLKVTGLSLMAGRRYRVALKFCAERLCYKPVTSDGVTILANPPTVGTITTQYDQHENTIHVELEPFRDPDIEDKDEAREVIDHYEWALTDNGHTDRLLTKWQRVNTSIASGDKTAFQISVKDNITFTKCRRVSVRGYNKAGLSTVVSSEIKNCSDVNQVRPHVVIDAVGKPTYSKDDSVMHQGQSVMLRKNNLWTEPDSDYTPYKNILSAVWPSLRYPLYSWAVLEVKDEDATVFYESEGLDLADPCLHPDAVQCGTTDVEYVNVMVSPPGLQHGVRYMICIHSNATSIEYEKWSLDLEELDACSDGVTVDLTPPIKGQVWIGKNLNDKYQSSTSCLTVNWQSFIDVEEEGHSAHVSGVAGYQVAIGSSHGGVDIVEFTDVGLTNHHMFHGLRLQNGHSYFATVRAKDFTGQITLGWSRSIRVDASPPILTGQPIQLAGRHITDTARVSACWKGVFADMDSGMSHYEWSVGSERGYDDIMTYTITDMECSESDSSVSLNLTEGHAYFVSVKGYDNAGHYTLAVSWAFTVDASPPHLGHVFDGRRPADGTYRDIDYTTSTSVLDAHWTEFYEPHGALKEYSVHVGSCVECDDILKHQSVGLMTEIHLSGLLLSEGQRYYVTVTACNTADMCTVTSSDGTVVDRSPPIAGRVQDGVGGVDIQYQSSRLYLGAEWFGFTDAQSDISHYVWRAGTQPGADDVLGATSVIRSEKAYIVDLTEDTGKQLPVGQRIYTTVRAYNLAGMYSESTSNGFIVDTSGPVFSGNVTHRRIGSVAVNTSVLPSVVRVEWEVGDNESFIDEQYLSIESHLGGDFNASSVKVAGLVRDYTFSDLDLHDGSVYCVNLVSCNGARICAETRLQHLLVDSSPPTPGMFAIDTDHAISLEREPDSWMTWSVLYVNLAWLGFQDVHSGIDRYMINIGSTFMGNDLHKVSSRPHVVAHNDTGTTTAEGSVQVYRIWTKSLAKQRSIFVSIWAINGVGLSSPIIHHEFELVQGGDLELVRRCSAHTCLGHCVCAPHGQLCHPDNFCNDLSNDTSSLRVTVEDMLDLTFDPAVPAVFFYPTRTLTAARWSMTSTAERKPLWYEWSIGETLYGTPKGVFDVGTERVWHDAGQNTSWIFTHPRGHFLKEKTQYSFFLRAWFDENTYAIYKSPGVVIYSTPPLSVSIQGKRVKELLVGSGQDVDFVTPNMPLLVDWRDRFADTHGSLLKYHLYISTYPGGHDAHCVAMNLPPTQTSYNITGLKLLEDTKYYSVVQVFNKAGYHRTEWSDGFLVDSRPPVAGIVHDGEVLKDIHALNSSRWIPSFWYGFTDADAGIKSYNVCVMARGGRHCNVHPQVNVGLNTHAELLPNEDISDGTVLHSAVQALDFVGLKSAWVKSNGVVIDSSSPIRSSNYKYSENIIRNPSYEVSSSNDTINDIRDIDSCTDKPIHSWTAEKGGCCLSVKTSGNHLPADGLKYVILSGVMYQDITNLTVGSKYRLTFYTSHVPSGRTLLSNSEGFVEINNEKHAFLLYNKPSLSQVNRESDLLLSWHKHTYFFHSMETTTRLRISTMGRTSHIAVDFVSLEARDTNHDGKVSEQQGHIQAHTVFIHDWSSIHAEWNFVEEDSEIVEYLWAIGTVEGGTQLQPFTSVGKRTFAFTSSLHLVHDTTVFVTVMAVNAASLRTVSYSDPILIDLTPPEIVSIFDGNVQGEDIDFQRGYKVTSSWFVRDVESGIRDCDWAIDTGASDIRIQNFTAVPSGLFNVSADVRRDSVIDDMIYVSVRCTNNAGLVSHSSSDGVMILTSPPSADGVLLEILGTSLTQYPVKDGYHGDMSLVRFRWIGFDVDQGIDSYLVSLDGANVHEEEIVTASRNGFTYASFTNLQLADGNYSVSVVARNHLDMYSKKQIADFSLLTTRPFLTGGSINCAWTSTNHELHVSWPSVFSLEWPLYYEVTLSWADGGEGDIVQWQETKDNSLLVSLSLDDIPQAGINVRVSVRAINPAGQFTTAQTETYVTV